MPFEIKPVEVESMSEKPSLLGKWQTVAIVLLTWGMATAVQWGLFTERLADHDRRITKLEESQYIPANQAVTKSEYEELRSDILSRMDRFEHKVDELSVREPR